MGKKSWSSRGKEGKTLRKSILDGNWLTRPEGAPSAKAVYYSNPIYQKWTLDNFRQNYRRMQSRIEEELNIAKSNLNELDNMNGEAE